MAEKKKAPLPDDDDGHVIAPMNVEGMPWYNPNRGQAPVSGSGGSDLSPAQRRMVIWGAIRTGLLIFLVFAVIFFLFLLFADNIWLR